MKRWAWALVVLVAVGNAHAGDGLGKAKEQLAKEFKGKQLRLRVDVLQWSPGDARVATTAGRTEVSYPNMGQPLQFPAFGLVEVNAFYGWQDGIRISIQTPGYKPHLFSSGLAASMSGNVVTEANQSAAKDAEMRTQMGYVNLRVSSPSEDRSALARLFYIDGAQPTADESKRCVAASRAGESPELTAARCGVSVELVHSLQQQGAGTQ